MGTFRIFLDNSIFVAYCFSFLGFSCTFLLSLVFIWTFLLCLHCTLLALFGKFVLLPPLNHVEFEKLVPSPGSPSPWVVIQVGLSKLSFVIKFTRRKIIKNYNLSCMHPLFVYWPRVLDCKLCLMTQKFDLGSIIVLKTPYVSHVMGLDCTMSPNNVCLAHILMYVIVMELCTVGHRLIVMEAMTAYATICISGFSVC